VSAGCRKLDTPVCFSQWRAEAAPEEVAERHTKINREHFVKRVVERRKGSQVIQYDGDSFYQRNLNWRKQNKFMKM
jgi:hypothetical protein